MFKRFMGRAAAVLSLSAVVTLQAHADAAPPANLADSCTSLTPTAVQDVVDAIDASLDKAILDEDAYGTSGSYPVAPTYNRRSLEDARTWIVDLQTWLNASGLATPYVSSATGAYNIHSVAREAVLALHYARHWAMISAVYHTSDDAFDSYELTSDALTLIDSMSADAGRCYMSGYLLP